MANSQIQVGIDLGTTNSAVSFILPASGDKGNPKIQDHLPVQMTKPFEWNARPLLPSFLYFAGENELPEGCMALPWHPQGFKATSMVGEFARNQGVLVPGRLVQSAKSWLSVQGSDRSGKILPYGGAEDCPRISPLDASSLFLRHLVESWNNDPQLKKHSLSKQRVVLTIPASFDDVARRLTLEAAKKAGLEKPILLEEPQAAFYCWMGENPTDTFLKPGMRILVIDVGGGTTDFTLIETGESDGGLGFSRKAIGDHLLLGGDNMDMALARQVESRLPGGKKLGTQAFQHLVQKCREAKEGLLSNSAPDKHTILLEGRGRSLVGGSQHHDLFREEVEKLILDGFFPVDPHVFRVSTPSARRQGVIQSGLPYAQDAAITRHLFQFLDQHGCLDQAPDAVLLNGGVFRSQRLGSRIDEFLQTLFPGKPVTRLPLSSVDQAVARGAAHYAWLTYSGGKTIRSHSAKSYYLPLLDTTSQTDKYLCILPGASREEQEHSITQLPLELQIGAPVRFPLFSSTVRLTDEPGKVIEATEGQLHPLPALQTKLEGGRKSGEKAVRVDLVSKLSAIGTLDLHLLDRHGNRWHLDFNLANPEEDNEESRPNLAPLASLGTATQSEDVLSEAAKKIGEHFPENPSDSPPLDPATLIRDLEKILESSRQDWSAATCRFLWDALAKGSEARRVSQKHIFRWYNLAGWLVRPGFGYPNDAFRVEQLWKILHAPPRGTQGMRQPEGGPDLWVLFRRTAGGLPSGKQNMVFDRLRPFLLPTKGKAPYKPSPAESMEMWRCASTLERVAPEIRRDLGEALSRKIKGEQEVFQEWQIWSLGRLGARLPSHGPFTAVIPPAIATAWVEILLPLKPDHVQGRHSVCLALALIGRKTDNPDLDIAEETREKIKFRLEELECPEAWIKMLEGISSQENSLQMEATFGESLPLGLRLAGSEEPNG